MNGGPARTFRYDTGGSWFKGNTHIHSTRSDGGKSVPELIALYHGAGYDFIFLTDHWTAPDCSGDHPAGLLVLEGIEIDGRDESGSPFHIIGLGRSHGISREDGLIGAYRKLSEQGAILVLAHPHWTGNSTADALRYPFAGVEVFNYVSGWALGKESGAAHWDAMLEARPDTLGFAADDAHIRQSHPVWNGGWIWVNAAQCTEHEIMAAIRRGNFYSSTGPQIHSLEFSDKVLSFSCSSAAIARLIGPRGQGITYWQPDGGEFTVGSFSVTDGFSYGRLEVEDRAGRKAWTNNIFRDQNPK